MDIENEPGVKNEHSAPICNVSKSRRIWMPKFSIFSLLLSVTAVAVLLAGFIGSRKIQTLQKLADRNEVLETRQKVFDRAMQLLKNVDPDDSEKHDGILRLIQQIPPLPDPSEPSGFSQLFFVTQAELTNIDSEAGGFELLQLCYDPVMRPSRVSTALALFRNGTYVDSVLRTASTRTEDRHAVRTADVNGDGTLDAIIEIGPGSWETRPKSVVFEISGAGFTLLSDW